MIITMTNPQDRRRPHDRVLLVESDPVISDLVGRQALQSSGYQVQVAKDAASAIAKAVQWSPDLILVDLNLPGLSGKDLLVALGAQGVTTPVIILANRGSEGDIIQTFRLGAADYLLLPAREAEVINAVSRVLRQVNDRRERERLAAQVEQANQELQARVRELTTIFALGKAMTSVTDQSVLLDVILDGSRRIVRAEIAWFLLRDKPDQPFRVAAERGLPPALGVRINQPWDDGISSLVAMSGEALNIHGAPLLRLKISSLGSAALVVPIKVQNKILGILSVMRGPGAAGRSPLTGSAQLFPPSGPSSPEAFTPGEQRLLEALADFASVSLVNARLFRSVEDRVRALENQSAAAQLGETISNDLLRAVRKELVTPVSGALTGFDRLVRDPLARWRPDQRQALTSIQDQLLRIHQVTQAIELPARSVGSAEPGVVDLTAALTQSLRRVKPLAQPGGLTLAEEIAPEPLQVRAEGRLLAAALDGLLISTVRRGAVGSQVLVRLEKTDNRQAHLQLSNSGWFIDAKAAENLLEDGETARRAADIPKAERFGGLSIRLSLVKEIIHRLNGKIWVVGSTENGTEFHVSLPLAR